MLKMVIMKKLPLKVIAKAVAIDNVIAEVCLVKKQHKIKKEKESLTIGSGTDVAAQRLLTLSLCSKRRMSNNNFKY